MIGIEKLYAKFWNKDYPDSFLNYSSNESIHEQGTLIPFSFECLINYVAYKDIDEKTKTKLEKFVTAIVTSSGSYSLGNKSIGYLSAETIKHNFFKELNRKDYDYEVDDGYGGFDIEFLDSLWEDDSKYIFDVDDYNDIFKSLLGLKIQFTEIREGVNNIYIFGNTGMLELDNIKDIISRELSRQFNNEINRVYSCLNNQITPNQWGYMNTYQKSEQETYTRKTMDNIEYIEMIIKENL